MGHIRRRRTSQDHCRTCRKGCAFVRHKVCRRDLGEGVVYALVERPGVVVLIVNQPELVRRARRFLGRLGALRPPARVWERGRVH